MDVTKYIETANKILSPIIPANDETKAEKIFLFTAIRSKSSYILPEYYLIYFLFYELLKYKNSGQYEKIAWSFPIDYKGKAFLIEHRKFGVGIFINSESDENEAAEIAKKINGAVKSIRLFYDYLAEKGVNDSKINVVNNNHDLYERFLYLLKLHKAENKKYLKYKDQYKVTTKKSKYEESTHHKSLSSGYLKNANWLAISCIEAFYSWTEHLFIHLAIIYNGLSDGKEIAKLINEERKTKFKSAIPLKTAVEQIFLNELSIVRQQLRNFVAHGAFGKDGNAFSFHSGAGAVPVLMNHKKTRNKFSFHGTLSFDEQKVIELIEEFIKYLWASEMKPAMFYTQECDLPTIVPYAKNGFYRMAVESMENMEPVAEKIMRDWDNAANMDW